MRKIRKVIKRIANDLKKSGIVLILFLLYDWIMNLIFNAFCPFLITTGIPCAGCGLTRALLFLGTGQALRAFRINPSIFLILIFLLYCGYFRYIKGRKVKHPGAALGILVLCMLVIYVCRMYLYFPDRVPYVYKSDNLAAGWIPGYEEWMRKILHTIRSWRAR